MVNIVGDHATYAPAVRRAAAVRHRDASARNVSGWVRTSQSTAELGGDAAAAVAAAARPARTGGDADPAGRRVLVGGRRARRAGRPPLRRRARRSRWSTRWRRRCAAASPPRCCSADGAAANPVWWPPPGSPRRAGRSCWPRRSRPGWSAAPGCRPSSGSPTWPSSASAQLAGLRHLVLVDAKAPVSFFAYPGKPELPARRTAARCTSWPGLAEDAVGALDALADAVGRRRATRRWRRRPVRSGRPASSPR